MILKHGEASYTLCTLSCVEPELPTQTCPHTATSTFPSLSANEKYKVAAGRDNGDVKALRPVEEVMVHIQCLQNVKTADSDLCPPPRRLVQLHLGSEDVKVQGRGSVFKNNHWISILAATEFKT